MRIPIPRLGHSPTHHSPSHPPSLPAHAAPQPRALYSTCEAPFTTLFSPVQLAPSPPPTTNLHFLSPPTPALLLPPPSRRAAGLELQLLHPHPAPLSSIQRNPASSLPVSLTHIPKVGVQVLTHTHTNTHTHTHTTYTYSHQSIHLSHLQIRGCIDFLFLSSVIRISKVGPDSRQLPIAAGCIRVRTACPTVPCITKSALRHVLHPLPFQ